MKSDMRKPLTAVDDDIARMFANTEGDNLPEWFDFQSLSGPRDEGAKPVQSQPTPPTGLDQARHEKRPDPWEGEPEPTSASEEDADDDDRRRPSRFRWAMIALQAAGAAVLILVLMPWYLTGSYLRQSFSSFAVEQAAHGAANVRDAVPAFTDAVQAHMGNMGWFRSWFEEEPFPPSMPQPDFSASIEPIALTAKKAPPPAPVAVAQTGAGASQKEHPSLLTLAFASSKTQGTAAPKAPPVEAPAVKAETPADSVLGNSSDTSTVASATLDTIAPNAAALQMAVSDVQPQTAPPVDTIQIPQFEPPRAWIEPPTEALPPPEPLLTSSISPIEPIEPADVVMPAAPSAQVPPLTPTVALSDADPILPVVEVAEVNLSVAEQVQPVPAPQPIPEPRIEFPVMIVAPSLSPRIDLPAPPDPNVIVAEALAKERKEALERERARADILARELADLRDEIGALKAMGTQSWITAPALPPLPAPAEQPTAMEPGADPEPVLAATTEQPLPPVVELAPPIAQQMSRPTAQAAVPAPAPTPIPAPPASVPQVVAQAPPAPAITPNEQRLIERAQTLLKTSDISGARLILEHAMSTGSARAAYFLAQTYDPKVLEGWRVVGIKGDPAKAQELYAKAQAAGIDEAGRK